VELIVKKVDENTDNNNGPTDEKQKYACCLVHLSKIEEIMQL